MKTLFTCLLALGSISAVATTKCDIYEGLAPIENERPYASCEFDYMTRLSGIRTFVRSCALAERETDISYTFEAGIADDGTELISVQRSDSKGLLAGTRFIYFEAEEGRSTDRASVYHLGTTRVECRKL